MIELLVVIAIIAILAAILFPVFAQVREKARVSTCTSNAKQFELAILQYAQDADEALPIAYKDAYMVGAYTKSVTGAPLSGVPVQIMPYIKSTGVFKCPDDAGQGFGSSSLPAGLTAAQAAGHSYFDILGTSYKFTHQAFSNPYSSKTITGYKIDTGECPFGSGVNTLQAGTWVYAGAPQTVTGPATIFLSDFSRPSQTRIFGDWQKPFGDTATDIANNKATAFHKFGANIAYGDGHVKFLTSTSQYESGCDGIDWSWDTEPCNPRGVQRATD